MLGPAAYLELAMCVGEEAGFLERTMNEFCIRTAISAREPGGGERGRKIRNEAARKKGKEKEKNTHHRPREVGGHPESVNQARHRARVRARGPAA